MSNNEIFINDEDDTTVPDPQPENHIIYYDVDLPSNGKFGYPETIQYRDVLVKDEKKLATSSLKNYQTVLGDILKGLLKDQSYYDKMAINDRDYLLVWIWANTYSTIRDFETQCTHCGTKQEVKVDITKMDVKDLSEDYVKDFSMTLEKTSEEIKLNLLTVRDERVAEQYIKNNPKEDYISVLMALSINFGMVMGIKERMEYIDENIKGKEMATIRTYHKYFKFGIDNEVKHQCSQCGEVTEFEFPFSVEYFVPTIQNDFDRLLRSNKGT